MICSSVGQHQSTSDEVKSINCLKSVRAFRGYTNNKSLWFHLKYSMSLLITQDFRALAECKTRKTIPLSLG